MAFVIKYSVAQNQNGTAISITDKTGIYNSPSNIQGYGTPNPDWADITAVQLLVEQMDEDSVWTTVYNEDIFPDITPSDFFLDQEPLSITLSLTDGWFRTTYTVSVGATDYAGAVLGYAFYAEARVCFAKKAYKESQCKCGCAGGKLELLEMDVALRAIEDAGIAGVGLQVIDAVDYSKKLCTKCGCGC